MVKILVLCTLIGISILDAASFDCSKARSHVEKMICSDAEISSLDSKFGKIYEEILGTLPEKNIVSFDGENRQWIGQRNKCKNSACLVEQYITRINYLQTYNSMRPNNLNYSPQRLPGKYEVTIIELNIRDNHGKESNVLGTVKRGDKVDVYEFSGKWGRTKYGWISGKYLNPIKKGKYKSVSRSRGTKIEHKSQFQSYTQSNASQQHSKVVNNENTFQYKHNTATNKTSNDSIKKVIVTGMGINENKAIKNASKAAIQQVVGMYVVSDVLMKNSKLIKDEVLTQSNAYIKSFKTLNKIKDEDGLFEIEAEVEVEIGKLTNTLGELNIAVKGVGSDQFKAKALTNFSSVADFRAMVQKIIIEPIQKNNIYQIKINSFNAENEDVPNLRMEGRTRLTEDNLLPFKLNFSMTLSKNYIDSVENFFNKSAKESFDDDNKKIKNAIRIYQFTGLKGKSNSPLIVTEALRKLYVLSARNFKEYKKQMKNFKYRKKLKIKISILDSQNSVIKRFVYLSDTPKMITEDRSPIFINNKYYLSMRKFYISAMSMTDRGRSSIYLEGIPHYRDNFHILGNQELFTYLYLNEDEASRVAGIKVEAKWE